jgi:hypothetical protein
MHLAHRAAQAGHVLPVPIRELREAAGRRVRIGRHVLLPQKRQRHARALQFGVHAGVVGQDAPAVLGPRRGLQLPQHLRFLAREQRLRVEPAPLDPRHVLRHHALRDAQRLGNRLSPVVKTGEGTYL